MDARLPAAVPANSAGVFGDGAAWPDYSFASVRNPSIGERLNPGGHDISRYPQPPAPSPSSTAASPGPPQPLHSPQPPVHSRQPSASTAPPQPSAASPQLTHLPGLPGRSWMGRAAMGEIVSPREEGINKAHFQPQTTPVGTKMWLSETAAEITAYQKGEVAWWYPPQKLAMDVTTLGQSPQPSPAQPSPAQPSLA